MSVIPETLATGTARPRDGGTGSGVRLALRWLLVAGGYFLGARLGFLVPYVGTHVSLVWLPTGVALAALLRWGPGMIPAIYVGALLANASLGGPLGLAAAIGLGNVAGPWLASRLLQHWEFDTRLRRRADLVALLLAALAGMAVTATNGTFWLNRFDLLDLEQWPAAWLTWWIGDAVGVLLGGVPLLVVTRRTMRQAFSLAAGRMTVMLLAVIVLAGALPFSPWIGAGSALLFPCLAVPFFLIALLALRGRIFAASLAVLLLSITSAVGTAHGVGPFSGHAGPAGILALWSYITAQACTSLLICGLASELHMNRRQLDGLLAHAHDGVIIVNEAGAITLINPAASRLLGLAPGQVLGAAIEDLPHGNGPLLQACLQGGQASMTALHVLHPADGVDVPVELHAASYQDASGTRQMHLVLRDVSERSAAQARLAESERRLQAITDNVPAFISQIDEDERYVFANAQIEKLFGMPARAMLGKTMREVRGEQDYLSIVPFVAQAKAGQSTAFDTEVTAGGKSTFVHQTLVPAIDGGGRQHGFYSISFDVTTLRESERRTRLVMDNMPALISYVDADHRLQFANRAFKDLLGLEPEALVGRHTRELFGGQNYEPRLAYLERAFTTGERVSFEQQVIGVGSKPSYMRTIYVPDRDERGVVRGVYSLSMDITDLKTIEEQLRRLARYDHLTGLPNRQHFEERLDEVLVRSSRFARPFAVLFIDVDNFKSINDTRGHAAGDLVLKEIAFRLKGSLRGTDLVARLAGDEFVIVLEELRSAEEARLVARKILSTMVEPIACDGTPVVASCSIGIATSDGLRRIAPSAILAVADRALYEAKAAGRNTFAGKSC